MPKASDIPPCPDAPAVRSSGRATLEYKISLITPLFGGGVEAGSPDETLPIRGTSIRGQLQFWWRATRGAGFTTYQDLFARHAEIWGTTDKASPVELDVRVREANLKPCASCGGSDPVLPYVLFPFRNDKAQFIEKAEFTLRLRYPEVLQQDVDAAVWAWVNFGGLGARTRRGCGALLCKELAPCDHEEGLRQWFATGPVNETRSVRDWPTMPPKLLVGKQSEAPVEAWKRVIRLLQEFRQGQGIGRNPGQPRRPGRSRFPEPETLRRVTGQRSNQHGRLADIPDDAFPRAEFGLPIVFHFQGQGEPSDTVLYPSRGANGDPRDRMASPLILKPLALADGKAVPLILQLVSPALAGVELKKEEESLPLPDTTAIRDKRLATYRDSPLKSSPSGSALEAFLLHARQGANGFREVTR